MEKAAAKQQNFLNFFKICLGRVANFGPNFFSF